MHKETKDILEIAARRPDLVLRILTLALEREAAAGAQAEAGRQSAQS